MPATDVVWITRETTTVRHLRGLLEGLETNDAALAYTNVRILTVPADLSTGVFLAGELFPDGEPRTITDDNLPAQGIVFLPSDR